ncbi:MAG TPA: type II toxin-antitoxin system VapC family toxin [Thermoanaerobaculia bacterium]
MILLDTHVWVWWLHGDPELPAGMSATIDIQFEGGLAVSAISCWEVAKLVERKRLRLPFPIGEWMDEALEGAGIELIPLARDIAIASTSLPGEFHRDPADQIIVATARVRGLRLMTCDEKIRTYPYVHLADATRIHDR